MVRAVGTSRHRDEVAIIDARAALLGRLGLGLDEGEVILVTELLAEHVATEHARIAHPDKKILNVSLGKYIYVKFLSINETYEKAARSYESTLAVFRLTEVLQNATFVEEQPAKRNTRNQKQFEKLLVMQYENVKLTVGLQRSNQDLVQYCITVPQKHVQNKAIISEE